MQEETHTYEKKKPFIEEEEPQKGGALVADLLFKH